MAVMLLIVKPGLQQVGNLERWVAQTNHFEFALSFKDQIPSATTTKPVA